MRRFIFLPIVILANTFLLGNASAAGFQPVYTDRLDGIQWGAELPGTFTHGCFQGGSPGGRHCTYTTVGYSVQAVVDDSDAARACKALGARLPTYFEIMSLIRNFDHKEVAQGERFALPIITDQGFKDMEKSLGDMKKYYWSSSVSSQDNGITSSVLKFGNLGFYDRDLSASVRCVLDRP
jgi:hypothetical protein